MLTAPNQTHVLVVPENRRALVALSATAEALLRGEQGDSAFLFIHGPSGSGKTHLVSAVLRDVEQRGDGLTIVRLSASDFTLFRDIEEALASARQADLLVVEDLQHLPATFTESVVQLLDDRCASQHFTIVTADNGPGRLGRRGVAYSARLRCRLAAGLSVAISPLSAPSRLHLLEQLAQRHRLAVSPDILVWLAENLTTWRQLEGALVQMTAATPRTVSEAAALFENIARKPTVEHVAERVGVYYGVPPRRLRSAGRAHNVLLPRQVSMYLARRLTNGSLEAIGKYFGGRDHSTVLHACSKIETAMERDIELEVAVRDLETDLGGC